MAKKYRLICWFVLVTITLTAMSFAERPMVVVGNQSLDATVRSLLSDGIQLAVVPFPTETATTAESSQLIGTVLSARVTILDKSCRGSDVSRTLAASRCTHRCHRAFQQSLITYCDAGAIAHHPPRVGTEVSRA